MRSKELLAESWTQSSKSDRHLHSYGLDAPPIGDWRSDKKRTVHEGAFPRKRSVLCDHQSHVSRKPKTEKRI
jgi:hypothetical protein